MTSDEMSEIIGKIATTTQRDDAARYDLIIEAAPEDLALKREIFASLSGLGTSDTILASNTSSLSITAIAASSMWPERVAGMHFFNPAPVMPLVEVISGSRTAPETVQAIQEVATRMGKTPVVAADMPGFIVNRVARPFYGEALKILGEGTARVQDIDEAMKAAGFRMGPFELMDLIGIDINFAVTKSVYEAFFGEPRYRPHPIQQRMVEGGTLGRKSGRGFYSYEDGRKGKSTLPVTSNMRHRRISPLIPQQATRDFLSEGGIELDPEMEDQGETIVRILSMIINEAAFALGEGVASVEDIDRAMQLGTNYPKGPLKWADEIGLRQVQAVLKTLQETLGEERYRPAPLLHHIVSYGAIGDVVGEGFYK
jgi:3-hydroxybutyryl-CoA dehydrogenase